MAISERKKKILAAVVDAYIQTAEPVGSKAIAQNAGLGCSSATIRNELAELVAMGYLEQPHTSAGRVPTPMGYRMYVNELMDQQRLTIEESEDINRRLNQKLKELDDTISDVSRLASQLTNYPAMALTTREAVTILRFDLIYVDANTFIIVVMLSDHTVRNKLVHLPISVDEKMIKKLSTLFNANFTHIGEEAVTPVLISATERSADDTMGITAVISSFALEVLSTSAAPAAFVSGENRLLSQPEFRDPDKAHRLMSYLSGGGHILPEGSNFLDSNEVRVLIGPENVAEELADGLSRRLGGGEAPPEGMHNKLIIKGDVNDE